jgi:hypothetical protein
MCSGLLPAETPRQEYLDRLAAASKASGEAMAKACGLPKFRGVTFSDSFTFNQCVEFRKTFADQKPVLAGPNALLAGMGALCGKDDALAKQMQKKAFTTVDFELRPASGPLGLSFNGSQLVIRLEGGKTLEGSNLEALLRARLR